LSFSVNLSPSVWAEAGMGCILEYNSLVGEENEKRKEKERNRGGLRRTGEREK
jgi:hypothetical protein